MTDPTRVRTAMLIGEDAALTLKRSLVAVAGLGGVGSFAVEALVRAGIGSLVLIDADAVDETNINRQLQALPETVGQPKAEALMRRALSIRPDIEVRAVTERIDAGNAERLIPENADYIVDCVDDVNAKVALCVLANERSLPIISALGMGNRLYPERIRLTDVFETSGCPLASKLRHRLRREGIERLRVAFSDEPPVSVESVSGASTGPGKRTVGSVSFVPSACGLIMAGEVVRGLIQTPVNS